MSINKVIVTGNLTRDAELRTTPGGTSLANFGIAVNDRRHNMQTDQWEDYANFFDCTIFGRRAEALVQYLTKGTKVAIEGRLHFSSWEDKNTGQRRSKVDITVTELEFMSSRHGSGGANGANSYAGNNSDTANNSSSNVSEQGGDDYSPAGGSESYSDEEIPF